MLTTLARISFAIAMGVLARYYMLRVDYRQYPSYPHGYVIHMSLGLIAASLGALAIPALLKRDYMAVTILALAAQQFREVRDMERRSLERVEETELVPRGAAYIEGIARVFEARNYLAMLVGLIVSSVVFLAPFHLMLDLILGGVSGVVSMFILNKGMVGGRVGDIAVVRQAELRFAGSLLMVEDIILTNIGLRESRERYLSNGLAVIIEPKDDNARATLANLGQRQAIAHDAATIMGVRLDVSEPEFVPLARLSTKTGRVAFVILPIEKDIESLLEAIRRVPVLESAKRSPLRTLAGRYAED
ncbi:MAG TPA: hypothetical protein GXX51_06165 [Firmicutes bacterium]|nr:hypothetical protein [Bacillota bacterium]